MRGIAIAFVALLVVALPVAAGESVEPVIVFVVRHAEKVTGEQDPGLTARGLARAQALASMLGGAGVTHLYATEYRRTQDTLGPLAESSGHEVRLSPARDVAAQARQLETLPPGSVAVVAGHSNTVTALVVELSGQDGASVAGFDESIYDRLYMVVLPPAGVLDAVAVTSLLLSYGNDTP